MEYAPQQREGGGSLGNRELSWPVACIALLGLALLVFTVAAGIEIGALVGAWKRPADPLMPPSVVFGVWVLIVGGIALCYWAYHREKMRPDLMPDVLATLLRSENVYQLDRSHVAGMAMRRKGAIRFVFLVQTTDDSEGTFDVRHTSGNREVLLEVKVPRGSAILVWRDVPVQGGPFRTGLQMRYDSLRGRPVRYAKRQAMSSPDREAAIMVAQLFGGGIIVQLGNAASGAAEKQVFPIDRLGILNMPEEPSELATAEPRGTVTHALKMQASVLWKPGDAWKPEVTAAQWLRVFDEAGR